MPTPGRAALFLMLCTLLGLLMSCHRDPAPSKASSSTPPRLSPPCLVLTVSDLKIDGNGRLCGTLEVINQGKTPVLLDTSQWRITCAVSSIDYHHKSADGESSGIIGGRWASLNASTQVAHTCVMLDIDAMDSATWRLPNVVLYDIEQVRHIRDVWRETTQPLASKVALSVYYLDSCGPVGSSDAFPIFAGKWNRLSLEQVFRVTPLPE
jgi:hypothetical protein